MRSSPAGEEICAATLERSPFPVAGATPMTQV
jgi:hypothetical protein